MRVEAAADALAAVARHAVALDVAGDARVQVPLGLEAVVPGAAGRVAPDVLRGVETAAVADAAAIPRSAASAKKQRADESVAYNSAKSITCGEG